MADSETFSEVVPNALNGERVDRLVSLITDVSRSEAAELISEGNVVIDGKPITKGSRRVAVGASVEILVPSRSEEILADSSVKIPVLYDDEHVIVVNKPVGVVVHPGAGVSEATMVNGLLAQYPDIGSVGQAGRPGIVHRLDKDTSGLLMVARTEAAYVNLVGQLKSRTVQRRYQALVFGSFDSDSGTIDAPLGRSLRDATRQAVVMSGRPAVTHYEVLQTLALPAAARAAVPAGKPSVVSLLGCRLETGRTHQIRVHLTSIGHPILGDQKYGGTCELLGRPFLHAAELGFEHPASGTAMQFSAPLPAELEDLLAQLGPVRNM